MRKWNSLTGMYEEVEKTRTLKDIETNELSLVSKPANKKRFLFFKSEGQIDDLDVLIAKIETADIDEEQKTELLQKLNEVDNITEVAGLVDALTEVQLEAIEKVTESLWPSFQGAFKVAKASDAGEPKPLSEKRQQEVLAATFGPVHPLPEEED